MSPAAYLLAFAAMGVVVVALYVLYWRKHYRCKWRVVRVCPLHRGPNADLHYNVAVHHGKEVWLTDEQITSGKVRAVTLKPHPHHFE